MLVGSVIHGYIEYHTDTEVVGFSKKRSEDPVLICKREILRKAEQVVPDFLVVADIESGIPHGGVKDREEPQAVHAEACKRFQALFQAVEVFIK